MQIKYFCRFYSLLITHNNAALLAPLVKFNISRKPRLDKFIQRIIPKTFSYRWMFVMEIALEPTFGKVQMQCIAQGYYRFA